MGSKDLIAVGRCGDEAECRAADEPPRLGRFGLGVECSELAVQLLSGGAALAGLAHGND
jgi:hypothetical protein